GEHHLVSHEDELRQLMVPGERRIQVHPVHESLVEVADDSSHGIAAKAERVTEDEPHDGGDPHRNETLDHNSEYVPSAGETAVEESEPGGHQHDQAGGEKHETGSSCVEHKSGVLNRRCLQGPQSYYQPHFRAAGIQKSCTRIFIDDKSETS